jgi:hypothetical protein
MRSAITVVSGCVVMENWFIFVTPTKSENVRNALDGSEFLCRDYLTVYPNASIISRAFSSVRAGLFFIMFWIKSQ